MHFFGREEAREGRGDLLGAVGGGHEAIDGLLHRAQSVRGRAVELGLIYCLGGKALGGHQDAATEVEAAVGPLVASGKHSSRLRGKGLTCSGEGVGGEGDPKVPERGPALLAEEAVLARVFFFFFNNDRT
jgi:hypothetical protein